MTGPYSTNASVQTTHHEFVRGRVRPGQRPRTRSYAEFHLDLIDPTQNVAQVAEITITGAAAPDTPSIVIDGMAFPLVSAANVNDAAEAMAAALTAGIAEGGLLASVLASADHAAAVLTLTFADFEVHTVTFTANGSTTATVDEDATAASKAPAHRGGVFVAAAANGDPTMRGATLPTSISSKILGVVAATDIPRHQIPPSGYGLKEDEDWLPQQPYKAFYDGEVNVRIMADVTEGDPLYVYAVAGNTQNGWATNSPMMTSGSSQVTTGDVIFNGTDQVGVTIDGVTISVASNTSNNQTATDLRAAINNDPYFSTIVVASGATNQLILTFVGTASRIVAAYETGSAEIQNLATVAAVAPVARAVRYKNATFMESRTAAAGDAYADLG